MVRTELKEAGIAVEPLLEEAGLQAYQLNQDDGWLSYEAYARLLEAAAREFKDPYYGLNFARGMDPRDFGALAYVGLSSKTLEDALLNLAVKLNETTNFTILWPDLRGHGENPLVNRTLFGAVEGDDTTAAIDYLRTLKGPTGKPQVAGPLGVYGIQLGAYAALDAAKRYPEVRALALDSAPGSPDDLVRSATSAQTGMSNGFVQRLARWGVKAYSFGKYQGTPSCELALSLRAVRVLLLTGSEGDPWRNSTLALGRCFNGTIEVKKDLPLTGISLPTATGQQEDAYDRPVIEFFNKALR
jgi:hypothetical protein